MEMLEKTKINILKIRKLQFDIRRLNKLNEAKPSNILIEEINENTKELNKLIKN